MSTPSNYQKDKWDRPVTYAVKHKDLETRMNSRSGGIFTALSDEVLNNGGVVYGCVLDELFTAIHVRAESKEVRDKMRGSKYVQSEMCDIYRTVKKDLDEGRKVLFSGTSCQVAGLTGYLGKTNDSLLCVDIVCHGVPSPKIWKDYVHWQEQKNGSRVVSVDFRNKKDYGWKAHIESLFFENGRKIDSRVYTTLFYGHSILRPCCYKCPYKDIIHPGNITIADYWGVDQAAPGFNDNKGVSLVMINDRKGQKAFDTTRKNIVVVETTIEDSMQPPLKAPYDAPHNRQTVWNDYYKLSFEREVKKYGGYGFYNKIKRKLRLIIGSIKK